jgi:hypothetical protein
MATKKLGQLCGVGITRIVDPVGVRVRCEFVSVKHPTVEFEISGDLALGIAKELEMLLPMSAQKKTPARRRQRVPVRQTARRSTLPAKMQRKAH